MKFTNAFGWFLPIIFILLFLHFFPEPILPNPHFFLIKFFEIISGSIWLDIFYSSIRSLLAFFISLILGFLLIFFIKPQSTLSKIFFPSILLLHTSPVIVWIVPLVLYFGVGHLTPILASALVVLPLIFLEFRTAFSVSTKEKREFWKHYVPNFKKRIILRLKLEWLPYLLNCVSLGFLLSFKASVIAEWFSAQNGLGKKMQQAFLHVDLASFFTYSLLFVTTALSLSYCLKKFFEKFSHKPSSIERNLLAAKAKKIALQKVTFAYGKKIIFKNLTFTLRNKEILSLSGPSGSGKTTLAKLLAGIVEPQQGNTLILPRNTAFLFQSDIYFPNHSVRDNVIFFLPKEKYAQADSLLQNLGLNPEQKAQELSGGMRRKLSLARALLQEANFLILDEPFAQLDQESVKKILKILENEKVKGRGILIISHEHLKLLSRFTKKNFVLENYSLRLST